MNRFGLSLLIIFIFCCPLQAMRTEPRSPPPLTLEQSQKQLEELAKRSKEAQRKAIQGRRYLKELEGLVREHETLILHARHSTDANEREKAKKYAAQAFDNIVNHVAIIQAFYEAGKRAEQQTNAAIILAVIARRQASAQQENK